MFIILAMSRVLPGGERGGGEKGRRGGEEGRIDSEGYVWMVTCNSQLHRDTQVCLSHQQSHESTP